MNNLTFLLCCLWICTVLHDTFGVLYPYESETRETKSLNGLWNFNLANDNNLMFGSEGFPVVINSSLFLKDDVIKMPVPSSFNDVTTNSSIRDYVGWVIYEKEFYLPKHWKQDGKRVFIHFGSVHYICFVFVNDNVVGSHLGGHIPFQVDITSVVKTGLNSVIVFVNNTLTSISLPQGFTRNEHPVWHPSGFSTYSHNCDYFDYAGINRPVTLLSTPSLYICDIFLDTGFEDDTGFVVYNISVCGNLPTVDCNVLIYDKKNVVAENNHCTGKIFIKDVKLWWPIMTKQTDLPGFLYTLEVHANEDIYRLPIGIRTVTWSNSSLHVNNVPVYFRGFGMHEDSDIRGRGFDNVILARDINLIKWLGVNSFRTSHYPYADETLNEADSLGILVILETPACSLDNFDKELLEGHKSVLREIVHQHRNRPSVIMWSLANEPNTNLNSSESYFRELVELSHKVDKSRPVTFVTSQRPENDKAVKFFDIICVNRYNGWYQYPGMLEIVQDSVIGEITEWYTNFSKPVIITEYGADSYVGQHNLPASMWTEDFQVLVLLEHFKAFDALRKKGFFIGEMIWNFIDFQVPQEYFRPGRCDKGLFTRNRQPKPAAYIVKERYHKLANEVNLTNCNSRFDDYSVNLI